MQQPLGLLIMAYGTPETLDDVEPYYTHIRSGRPPTPEALAELIERYRAIGGKSPLTDITRRQADGVAQRLAERLQRPVHPYVGMKHAPPFIADTVQQMVNDGLREIVAMVMTPQYSAMSVGAYQNSVQKVIQAQPAEITVRYVDAWHLVPEFVRVLAGRVSDALASLPSEAQANCTSVFTAHSLPQRIVEKGDPYARHLQETASAVAEAAGIQDWMVAYQSAGRSEIPWLGPDVTEVIPQLAAAGTAGIVVCPVGFVADHLEVLYDLDIEARQTAEAAGLAFARTASLNDSPDFLDALAAIAAQEVEARRT